MNGTLKNILYNLLCIFCFSVAENAVAKSPVPIQIKTTENAELTPREKPTHWLLSIGSWRENSLLLRTSDSKNIKINTLNVIGRIDRRIYFSNNQIYLNLGLFAGKSENANATTDFTYFQRSVMIIGAAADFGMVLFANGGAFMGLSLGGIYRSIDHALPSSDYQFSTKNKFLPLISLDLSWKFLRGFYFQQRIGTLGSVGDTLWLAGLGMSI